MLIGNFDRTDLQVENTNFRKRPGIKSLPLWRGKKYAPPKAGIEDYIINLSFNQYRILSMFPNWLNQMIQNKNINLSNLLQKALIQELGIK